MGNAFLLIVVGLLLFYVVISDKWKCVEGFAGCVLGTGSAAPQPTGATLPTVPTVPTAPTIGYGYPDLTQNQNWSYNPYGI